MQKEITLKKEGPRVQYITGHVIDALRSLPEESVHCIITSPPYFGLRQYGANPQIWSTEETPCKEHVWETKHKVTGKSGGTNISKSTIAKGSSPEAKLRHLLASPVPGNYSLSCSKCGSWYGSLGLEPTPELYVEHLVQIFREMRRVLRSDGVFWLNMGDSYMSQGGPQVDGGKQTPGSQEGAWGGSSRKPTSGLKAKNLIGAPWRVALALQEDGWWLRVDCIWNKTNPMPSSVTDRPSISHEYVFLFTKSPQYYYDTDAVREPLSEGTVARGQRRLNLKEKTGKGTLGKRLDTEKSGGADMGLVQGGSEIHPLGRNRRSVWNLAAKGFPGSHFATFPPALVTIPILASTSEKGCCPACGTPWKRITKKKVTFHSGSGAAGNLPEGKHKHEPEVNSGTYDIRLGPHVERSTVGWWPGCTCGVNRTIPCTVLDPFGGSGTTAMVASKLGRRSILIDLSPEYMEMAKERVRTGK